MNEIKCANHVIKFAFLKSNMRLSNSNVWSQKSNMCLKNQMCSKWNQMCVSSNQICVFEIKYAFVKFKCAITKIKCAFVKHKCEFLKSNMNLNYQMWELHSQMCEFILKYDCFQSHIWDWNSQILPFDTVLWNSNVWSQMCKLKCVNLISYLRNQIEHNRVWKRHYMWSKGNIWLTHLSAKIANLRSWNHIWEFSISYLR